MEVMACDTRGWHFRCWLQSSSQAAAWQNSSLPGASYFAFKGMDDNGGSILADDASGTTPAEARTPDGITYRARTFSSERSQGLRSKVVEWELVHGIRVAAEDEHAFHLGLHPSIRQALRACLPELGRFKSAGAIPQELTAKPGRVIIDGTAYIQYPLTIFQWVTRPARTPNAGEAFPSHVCLCRRVWHPTGRYRKQRHTRLGCSLPRRRQ